MDLVPPGIPECISSSSLNIKRMILKLLRTRRTITEFMWTSEGTLSFYSREHECGSSSLIKRQTSSEPSPSAAGRGTVAPL